MRVISKTRLRQFWGSPDNSDAEGPLRAWYTHVNSKSLSWQSWRDVKNSFAHASLVGDCIVFNIGGNKYRLIARIRYAYQKVFVLKVMAHREYDEGKWKGECGCFSPPPTKIPKPVPTKRPGRRKWPMAGKSKFSLKGAGRDSYLELVTVFPLASIKSDDQMQEAQKVMDRLLARGDLDDGAETYLDALGDLVATYEEEHCAIEPASDAEMLRHLMDAKGIAQAQLGRDTAIPKSTISEVLAGKKPFSRQMIRKLADYFGVDASVLAANF